MKQTRTRLLPDITLETLQINIYQFVEFHSLIRAYFDACKQQDRRYSYRYFSQRLQSKSPSFAKEVLDKKQKVSEKLFTILTEMLALKGDQFDYFESLYRLEQYPKGTTLHQRYYQRFRELRFRKPISLVEAQHDCVTSWFAWLIRELASLKGAHYNPLWFKKCLNPILEKNTTEVIEALELLKKAELLVETETGFEVPDPLKEMDPRDPRLKLYYEEVIELSLKFLRDSSKNREFGAFAIATSPEKYATLRQNLREFLDSQFRELEIPTGEGKMVAAFSFQLLNLAEIRD